MEEGAGTAQVPEGDTEDTRGATAALVVPATVVRTTDRVGTGEEEVTELGATEEDMEEGMEQGADTVEVHMEEGLVWERTVPVWVEGMEAAWGMARAVDTVLG